MATSTGTTTITATMAWLGAFVSDDFIDVFLFLGFTTGVCRISEFRARTDNFTTGFRNIHIFFGKTCRISDNHQSTCLRMGSALETNNLAISFVIM